MRDLVLTFVFLVFLGYGLRMPFILILGYVWIDILTPQLLGYSFLPRIPVSMIMGGVALVAILILPSEDGIRLRAASYMTIIFGIWMTITLSWAVLPDFAVDKWRWAIKSVLFTAIIPLFLRSRVQFEAFVWTIVVSGIAHCIPFGIKVLISGGGYGFSLGLVQANNGYGESSTLSMFSVSLIPMCIYLMRWQTLIPYPRFTKVMLLGFVALAVLTSLGTYARTGLICTALLALLLVLSSNRKLVWLMLTAAAAAGVFAFAGGAWLDRMSTINNGTDTSSMGRVAAWLWTLGYVGSHPLGGSFEMYAINELQMVLSDGSLLSIKGKAFHSIYFEVLGETGIPGFIMFALIIFLTFKSNYSIKRKILDPARQWLRDASRCLMMVLCVFLAGGAFIGIAFQSYLYLIAAMSVVVFNLSQKEIPE